MRPSSISNTSGLLSFLTNSSSLGLGLKASISAVEEEGEE
jgi:hypothetical protein